MEKKNFTGNPNTIKNWPNLSVADFKSTGSRCSIFTKPEHRQIRPLHQQETHSGKSCTSDAAEARFCWNLHLYRMKSCASIHWIWNCPTKIPFTRKCEEGKRWILLILFLNIQIISIHFLTFTLPMEKSLDLESIWFLWHSLFYNGKGYLKPFGRGGAVKLWEEKAHSMNEWIK